MGFKMSLAEAAKRLSIGIPGKGKATYTKNFLSGVIVPSPVYVGVSVDDALEEKVYANADGIRGSAKRVWRSFPTIQAGWKATIAFYVIDDEIPEDVFARCLRESGSLIGVGRFRPQRGGYFGRFKVSKLTWTVQD